MSSLILCSERECPTTNKVYKDGQEEVSMESTLFSSGLQLMHALTYDIETYLKSIYGFC